MWGNNSFGDLFYRLQLNFFKIYYIDSSIKCITWFYNWWTCFFIHFEDTYMGKFTLKLDRQTDTRVLILFY